jgi:hypothetical protein
MLKRTWSFLQVSQRADRAARICNAELDAVIPQSAVSQKFRNMVGADLGAGFRPDQFIENKSFNKLSPSSDLFASRIRARMTHALIFRVF